MPKNTRTFVVWLIGAAIVAFGWIYAETHPKWPEPTGAQYREFAGKYTETYPVMKAGLDARMQEYSPSGDYLNYGATRRYEEGEKIKLDAAGLPMVLYGKGYWYNPVTISQFLLTAYGRQLDTDSGHGDVLAAAERLLGMQRADGAFAYNFPYRHYTSTASYRKGWISGMAQGVALSALARTYILTKDEKYLAAGNRALAFLNTPKNNGGPRTDLSDLHPSLRSYVFFLEYQTQPDVYTLNGFMFTLMGLYDWWKVTDSKTAEKLFRDGIRTLEKILPYYDLDIISSYDLSYITHKRPEFLIPRDPHVVPRYHAVHITQLQALNSVHPSIALAHYRDRWKGYLDK